jgi:tripartite-type tricarboxylate transporter receptor subunit TctC
LGAVSAALATYPDRRITLVVAYPPGGSTDIVARLLQQKLAEKFKQTIIVDNRSGAGGMLGSTYVAHADPDGYTIQIAVQTTHAVAPSFYKQVAYDPLTDFTPIAKVVFSPLVLVKNPSFQPKNVKELIKYAHENASKLNYAIGTLGDGTHMASLLFGAMANINPQAIPFRGEAPALTQVVGGQLPYMFCGIPSALSFIKGGQLVPLAVTGSTRSSSLPDVPTMDEAGLKGYTMGNWFGIFGPKGISQDTAHMLADSFREALKDPTIIKRLAELGYIPDWMSPEDFAAYVKSENERWAKVLAAEGHIKQ